MIVIIVIIIVVDIIILIIIVGGSYSRFKAAGAAVESVHCDNC